MKIPLSSIGTRWALVTHLISLDRSILMAGASPSQDIGFSRWWSCRVQLCTCTASETCSGRFVQAPPWNQMCFHCQICSQKQAWMDCVYFRRHCDSTISESILYENSIFSSCTNLTNLSILVPVVPTKITFTFQPPAAPAGQNFRSWSWCFGNSTA